MRYEVRPDGLYFGEGRLGPSNALYVDQAELPSLGMGEGVVRLRLPERVDWVFVSGGRVVGVEAKRPGDLVSSVRGKRLARQLRTLKEVVDVVCLGLRQGHHDGGYEDDVLEYLVQAQICGVVLIWVPESDSEVLASLARYRPWFEEGNRGALAALAGSDRGRRKPGTILRAIPGVGPKLERGLLLRFGTPLAVLGAGEEELKGAGVPKGVRGRIVDAGSAGL